MADVGQILLASRSLIPDAAQVLPAPSGLTSAQLALPPTLPAGSYTVQVTQFTGSSAASTWGETTATVLSSVTVDGAHGIQVTGALPVGVVKLRVYYGIGAVNQFQDFTSLPAQITTPGNAGVPPVVNRAYLPDTDGSFVGAQTIYQWLNEGLDKATDVTGGILDVSGQPTIVGASSYTFLNNWIKVTDMYFDGFLIYGGNRKDVFRRSPNASIPGIDVRVTLTPKTIVELYPQPNRTAASMNLSGNITATATSLTFTTVSGSLLSNLGLAMIGGNTATPEIVQYSANANGTTLSNLIRGLGGTQPQAWSVPTQISELNLSFGGARRAVKHVVGDAAKTILIPPGWESLLPRYIESRAREAEHEWKVASDLLKSFTEEVKAQQSAYKQLSGPCQIQDDYFGGASNGPWYGQGLGGRWALE